MWRYFKQFPTITLFKNKKREEKRMRALKLLKAIHEIDDNYIAESLLPSDLQACNITGHSLSDKDSIKRIKELTYKKIQALEGQETEKY